MFYVTYIVHLIPMAARSKYKLSLDFSRIFSTVGIEIIEVQLFHVTAFVLLVWVINDRYVHIFRKYVWESSRILPKLGEQFLTLHVLLHTHSNKMRIQQSTQCLGLDKTQGIKITYLTMTSSKNNFWHSKSFVARHQSLDLVIKVAPLL